MNIKQLEEAIQQAATELEEGSQIRFPDADSRDEKSKPKTICTFSSNGKAKD